MVNSVLDEYRDPRWQRKRLEIMDRDGFRCQACLVDDKELHVHHIEYGDQLWSVPDTSLQTLCRRCHHELGPHPKGGVYYQWVFDYGTKLVVGYRHCPECGNRKTNCHSGVVIFDCKCNEAGLNVPSWLSQFIEYQVFLPSGDAAYGCEIPKEARDRLKSGNVELVISDYNSFVLLQARATRE